VRPKKGLLGWLFSKERRGAVRHKSLPLVAFYWDGAEPVAHGVLDVSTAGLYLLTQQRWYPGTVLAMTLQRARAGAGDPARAIAVNARVVRSGSDGVGLAFVVSPSPEVLPSYRANQADEKAMRRFFKLANADTGQGG